MSHLDYGCIFPIEKVRAAPPKKDLKLKPI